jgi:hypothetical protein
MQILTVQRSNLEKPMQSTIPLLPCKSLEGTHEQTTPYLYGAVRRGEVDLHFASLSVYGAKNAFGASLVFVPKVQPVHQVFAEGLRAKYGRVPTTGLPRITRLGKEQTRFKVFDPSGNLLIYISIDEPEAEYGGSEENLSGLAQALENALFLRDTYANDAAAAKALDVALRRHATVTPIDRALALAARAELAVAMRDTERLRAVRFELQQIPLSTEDRERFRVEL